jgi:cobalt-zinc-cadmium efflux system protein
MPLRVVSTPHPTPGESAPAREGQEPRGVRRLSLTLGLVAVYMCVEVVGGLASGSLALLADAGHMLSDLAALALAVYAARVVRRPATKARTYGHYRAEALAALANGALLVAMALFIAIEAVRRYMSPRPVDGPMLLAVAVGGLLVNLVSLRILSPHQGETLNERGARLHVISDALGSVQAVLAGAAIWALRWNWMDPVASAVIAILVVGSAWALLRETVGVLFESAPSHIDVDRVRDSMLAVPGVVEVHDLHVWTITTGLVALSAHVGLTEDAASTDVVGRLRATLRSAYGIGHLTIEVGHGECEDAHAPV